jgi:lipoprotein-releasing system ATP-binding protein
MDPKKVAQRAGDLLELVGLKERVQHKMAELSGGERQRVAIARALVTDPLCILADEPTGNLDPKNADKVLQLFIELQKAQQTSVIMVTHNLDIAKKAERVFALEEGKLKEL